ncbi:cilia- and flagella-associated protein 251-like [Benincasa hispida]|uniref:cilia- and flagella-associated protein 251-like n=1 Tax=Benincasa hispida TaxID=102211 RepID=UPI0019016366|nr:cilia- and flagella-associated protein 251-like [Benincasa hispida]
MKRDEQDSNEYEEEEENLEGTGENVQDESKDNEEEKSQSRGETTLSEKRSSSGQSDKRMETKKGKELEICPLLATPQEMTMSYFAPFINEEKKVLQEVEEEMSRYRPRKRVVELSLNRRLGLSFDKDEMERFEGIVKIQQLMNTRMDENFDAMKISQHILTKKIDDLVESLKKMIDYMKTIQTFQSHASTSNLFMPTSQFEKELDGIEKEQEEKEEDKGLVDAFDTPTIIRRKDDDEDEEGQGNKDHGLKIPSVVHKEACHGDKNKESEEKESNELEVKVN